uniref:Uncharacterized protein n=1 Tax=Globisporangium ultimum (strain ATCC 200006 / CBS 805.95 / DAOM BR144) TaxID=431595 RepID=K3WH21_GLOUD
MASGVFQDCASLHAKQRGDIGRLWSYGWVSRFASGARYASLLLDNFCLVEFRRLDFTTQEQLDADLALSERLNQRPKKNKKATEAALNMLDDAASTAELGGAGLLVK